MKNLRIILPLALVLCLSVSCQDKEIIAELDKAQAKEAMTELEAFEAQAELEKRNEALVRRVIE